MRIGLFSDTYTPEINGVVTSIVTLQKELEKHGHTVFVVTTANSALHIQKDGNILRMPGVEIKKLYGYRLSSPFHVIGLNDIKQMNLDVIHVHTEFGIGIFARIVGRILSIPIVATYHTMYEDYTHYVNVVQSKTVDKGLKRIVSSLSRMYGDACNELISPSEKTKAILERYGVAKQIHVIPTGLDLARFDKEKFSREFRQSLRESLQIGIEEYMLLFVGRIAKEKSIDTILYLMDKCKKDGLPVRAVIVGDGPDLSSLKELASSLHIEDRVVFTGRVVANEVPQYYAASDFFVSASLSETQGLTFIEAMASGCIVFAQEKDIMKELIIEGESGFYFDNVDELFSKIAAVISSGPQYRECLSENARKAVEVLDSSYFYQSVIKVYERAVYRHKNLYKVKSTKLKAGNFEVVFENDVEEAKLLVSLDSFYKHHLQVDLLVSVDVLMQLKEEDEWLRAYQGAIRYLSGRDRTRKEMYDYLGAKSKLPINKVNEMIERFETLNYINDERYVKNQIDRMKVMLVGKKKILANLVKKGIPYEMANEALGQEDASFELQSAIQLIEKQLPTIRGKSEKGVRDTLLARLIRQGFHRDTIDDAMALITIEQDEHEQTRLLKKEFDKQKNKLSKRYQDKELRQRLFHALARKGFEFDMIKSLMEKEDFDGTNE